MSCIARWAAAGLPGNSAARSGMAGAEGRHILVVPLHQGGFVK
ncbi:hypothetical protein WDV93_12745 [Pantoea ananatis]